MTQDKSKMQYVPLCIAFFLVVTALILGGFFYKQRSDAQRFSAEVRHFQYLAELAREMIRDGAPGIVDDGGRKRIATFQDFFDYVARIHPELTSSPKSPNPFPKLLQEASYRQKEIPTEDASDVLFWSETIHRRPMGRVQLRLTANGQVMALLAEGVTSATMATTSTYSNPRN